MPSEPFPPFRGHPDRPVDPPPELTPRKKKSKSGSSGANAESRRIVASGNLFDQVLEPPLTEGPAPDAAVPPSTAALESPTQTDESKQDSGTSGTVTSAVKSPV